MEAIHLFLEIFTIREFSHWPEELLFFPFIILASYACVEFKHRELMVYILLLHPLQMLKSCDRTMSPLLNAWNKEGMCWISSTWQTVFCAEVHRVIFWSSDMAMSGNPFSHPTKIFQAHISLQTIYVYMINQRRNGYTVMPLQKRQQLRNHCAPLIWKIRILFPNSDWRLTLRPSAESSVYWLFQGRRLSFSCCNYSFSNSSYS